MKRRTISKKALTESDLPVLPEGDYFITEFVPYLINKVANKFNHGFIKDVRASKLITVSQWRVLAVLHARPGLSLNEIVEHVAIDQPSLSRIIDQLTARGLVSRAARQGDARFVSISLTNLGRALFEEIWPLSLKHTRRGLRHLSASEQATLVGLLRKVLAGLEVD